MKAALDQAATPAATTLPAIGQPVAGGMYAGVTTGSDGAPYALILLADKPAKALTWSAARKWAIDLQADLPTRPEAALLFALLKPQFEATWHWTSETHASDSSYAWNQYFTNGSQFHHHKSYAGRARAVRRLPLQSFNPSVAS
jgi:hypothetical protein